ncbi:DNA-methyltransferase [Leuconostoc citreum]|uniref:DNA-methyltransferase n=1 Tax=Leuconostoc citreum TaxID=33964 RepID=UPI0032DF78FB
MTSIYNMDCHDFINEINDNSIDLVVTDPPYNMNKAEWDKFDSTDAFLEFTYRWIDDIIPKLKNTASIYIFNTPFNSAYILQYLVKKGLIFQNWITWDKRDGIGASKRKYTHGQETILFFTVSKEYTFNFDEIRIPYESTDRIKAASKKGIIKNGKRWFPNEKGRLVGEVWHFSSARHKQKDHGKLIKFQHVTPKPLDLIERIIKASSNENDLVADPFVGSGTTGIAAKNLNRKFIINDFNKEYIELTKERIKNVDIPRN